MTNEHRKFLNIRTMNTRNADADPLDFYATHPDSVSKFLAAWSPPDCEKRALEPCCGEGHISRVLEKSGFKVDSFDLIDRGYGSQRDLFEWTREDLEPYSLVITNPPYKSSLPVVRHFVERAPNYVVFYLKIQFVETLKRLEFFREFPPQLIYVHSTRQTCGRGGGDFPNGVSAACYSWWVWKKGSQSEPILRWLT
jgi:hypothetical protein